MSTAGKGGDKVFEDGQKATLYEWNPRELFFVSAGQRRGHLAASRRAPGQDVSVGVADGMYGINRVFVQKFRVFHRVGFNPVDLQVDSLRQDKVANPE